MKRALQLLLSVALTLLFTWWAFKDTNWSAMFASMRTANYLWVVAYVGIILLIHLARTLRWGALLSGMEHVPFKPLNEASAIGFMMLIVLPFRLGEFARPFLIAQRSKIRRSAAMTSVVLERIVDGMTIALLLRGLLFFVHTDSPEVARVRIGANVMFGIFGGGLLFLLIARAFHDLVVGLVRKVGSIVSPSLGEKLAGVVDTFVGALRQLPSAPQMAVFFLLTGVYWGLNGLGCAVLSRAFACAGGTAANCAPMSLTLFQGFVVLSVLVVALMIPAAPGMTGTFQFGIKVGLSLFVPAVVVNSTGLAYANVMWLCQTLQQILTGLLFMSLSHASFRDIAGKLDDQSKNTAAA